MFVNRAFSDTAVIRIMSPLYTHSSVNCFLFTIGTLFATTTIVFGSTQFSLSVIPANQPVYLGEEVILTCQLRGFKIPLEYAVLFKHNDKGISEKCQVYDNEKYRLVCQPKYRRNATTYKLYIKAVSWADRGDWNCIYAANFTTKRLVIYAPSKLQKMSVVSLASPSRDQKQSMVGEELSLSQFGSSGKPLLTASSMIGGSMPSSQNLGYGTRVNPYDLSPGFELQLVCSTTCGYPSANISWTIANETTTKYNLATLRPNEVNMEICKRAPTTQDMTTTTSTFTINCARLGGLVGLNEIRCEVHGPQYRERALTRHVFVLCPVVYGLQRTLQQHPEAPTRGQRKVDSGRGERPLDLTSGEIVAVAVGVALALVIFCIGCLLMRNNKRKDSSPLLYFSHVPGQRV